MLKMVVGSVALRRALQSTSAQALCQTRQQRVHMSAGALAQNKKEFEVTFVRENGERLTAKGKVGDSLYDVIVNNDLDVDGFGACEGTLACSTCHVILKPDDFAKLNEQPTDEEMDMLDLAYGLCDTSRLGCQVFLTEKESGMEVKLPAGVNDQRGA